jgi:hypothetical protein
MKSYDSDFACTTIRTGDDNAVISEIHPSEILRNTLWHLQDQMNACKSRWSRAYSNLNHAWVIVAEALRAIESERAA